jgi:hypothetical protein
MIEQYGFKMIEQYDILRLQPQEAIRQGSTKLTTLFCSAFIRRRISMNQPVLEGLSRLKS